MTNYDTFLGKYEELNEEELFYKQYHIAKQDQYILKEYLLNVDRKEMDKHGYWLPELEYKSSDYLNEQIIDKKEDNIRVLKHNRYTPMFVHKHAFFEMVYIYKGSCENIVGNYNLAMKEGDICIIAPDVDHKLSVFNDSCIAFNIIIRRSTFTSTFMDLFNDDALLSLFFNRILCSKNANSYIMFSIKNDKYLKYLLNMLIVEGMKKDKNYKIVTENLLRSAFCLMLRKNSETILSNTTQVYTPIVVDMINYIQENFRTVSLKELANTFNYSPDYVGKLIKNHTGVSFMQILQDVRFKKACSLLVSTNLRVIDICCHVGYESVEFFTRRFKELYGKTPAEYRNQSISASFSS